MINNKTYEFFEMNSTLSKLPLSETTTNVYVVYSEEVLTTGYKSSILVIASPH